MNSESLRLCARTILKISSLTMALCTRPGLRRAAGGTCPSFQLGSWIVLLFFFWKQNCRLGKYSVARGRAQSVGDPQRGELSILFPFLKGVAQLDKHSNNPQRSLLPTLKEPVSSSGPQFWEMERGDLERNADGAGMP